MKHFLLIAINISFLFPSLAQSRKIMGTVTDECGNPVYGATIFLSGNGISAFSNKDGTYIAYIRNNGSVDSISCIHLLYKRAAEKIEGNDIVNFVLQRKEIKNDSAISFHTTHVYSAKELDELKPKNEHKSNINIINEDGAWEKFSVMVSAKFPGGKNALQKYFSENIHYPDSATVSNVKGIVKVGFMIGKAGKVYNAKIIKGVNSFADKSVISAVSKMPKWIPAVQNGRYTDDYQEISILYQVAGIMPKQ